MNSTVRFALTATGEPHALRRKMILARDPKIRELFGYDRRTALVTASVVVAQLALAGSVAGWVQRSRESGPARVALIASLAYLVGAPLTHWLSMAIHETSHRLAARTAAGNVAVALLANTAMVLPFALSFNRYHLGHHKNLGVLGSDTDLPLRFEVEHIGNRTFRKLAWVLLHPVVYLVRGLTFAKPFSRLELLNLALIVPLDVLLWRAFGAGAIGYLLLSFFFAHGLHPVAAHFLHEHYSFAGEQETFSYYGPLNWITFNVGYHNEHHDFMGVSGWRLPELRRRVGDYDRFVSHRSWTGILWRFITDRTLGYGSRIVRRSRLEPHGATQGAAQ